MPAFNILESIPTHFCRCARSIVILHMALFEVVLESRLKTKKIESFGINKKCRLSHHGS